MRLEADEMLAALLEPYPLEVCWQVMTVRSLILDVSHELKERVYLGWRIVKFDDAIYIDPKLAGVYVGFLKGVYLLDPFGLLAGDAKKARRYWWALGEDWKRDELKELISAALTFEMQSWGHA